MTNYEYSIHNRFINNPSFKSDKKDSGSKGTVDKKLAIGAAIGLSAVSFCTAAGLMYFTRNHSILKKYKRFSGYDFASKTAEDISFYNEMKTTFVGNNAYNNTLPSKPKWDAVVSGYSDALPESEVKSNKKANPKNWRQERKNEVVPGIIRQISVGIKEYMKKCGIDKNNNKINPEALDEILTKAVGEGNVKERPYQANGVKDATGRIKEYTSPNGKIYVLESHSSPKGVVTRLYMQDKDKHLRAYLHADGTFRLNSYTSDEAHFDTTAKGKRWMEKAKKPKNQDK